MVRSSRLGSELIQSVARVSTRVFALISAPHSARLGMFPQAATLLECCLGRPQEGKRRLDRPLVGPDASAAVVSHAPHGIEHRVSGGSRKSVIKGSVEPDQPHVSTSSEHKLEDCWKTARTTDPCLETSS